MSADISAMLGVPRKGAARITGITGNTDPSGFLGGAQIGFNWQTGAFVFGIEGDWSWTNADGSIASPVALTTEHNWYGTATARVGYAVDNWLWYVKGGAAWLDADYTIGGVTFSDTRTGWTVGTGIEWALGPNWSAKLEYNYMDFGKDTVGSADSGRSGHAGPCRQSRRELPLRLGQGSGCRAVLIRTSISKRKTPGLGPGFLFARMPACRM